MLVNVLARHAPLVAVAAHASLLATGHAAEAATGHLHVTASAMSTLAVDLGLFAYGLVEAVSHELHQRAQLKGNLTCLS